MSKDFSEIPVIRFYIREEPYGFLSNFWRCPQKVYLNYGRYETFPTNEHYYQSMKAKYDRTREWIASAPTAMVAMTTGRALPEKEMRSDWNIVREEIMLHGLRAKFENETLRLLLLWTGNAELVEDSPTDWFWGGSLPGSQNALGKLLMKVRDEIRAELQSDNIQEDFL